MEKINIKHKDYITIAFTAYIALLVYFMFFGFDRLERTMLLSPEYRYSIMPRRIPLWLPRSFSIDILKRWIFAVGNLLAFVPFGIFVPVLYEKFRKYLKFLIIFLLFIVSMETLQMLTYLGRFDTQDVIVNTMGATIGFISYKISRHIRTPLRKAVAIGLSILLLSWLAFMIAIVFNNTFTPYLEMMYGRY